MGPLELNTSTDADAVSVFRSLDVQRDSNELELFLQTLGSFDVTLGYGGSLSVGVTDTLSVADLALFRLFTLHDMDLLAGDDVSELAMPPLTMGAFLETTLIPEVKSSADRNLLFVAEALEASSAAELMYNVSGLFDITTYTLSPNTMRERVVAYNFSTADGRRLRW